MVGEKMNLGFRAALFVFLVVISSGASTNCEKHECYDSDKAKFDSLTCIYIDTTPTPDVWYHRSCDATGTECQALTSSETNYTCQTAPTPSNTTIYAGEKCGTNTICASGSCNTDSICTGAALNSNCTDPLDCDINLRCDLTTDSSTYQKCINQLVGGATGCTNDFDCQNAYGCYLNSTTDSTKNMCVKYYSLDKGTEINSNNCKNNQSQFCEYTNCAQNATNQKYYCTEKMELDDQSTKCGTPTNDTSPDCVSNKDKYTGVTLSNPCQCGYNSDAQAYCSPFYGNDLGEDLQDKTSDWLSSSDNQDHCNTARRKADHCAMNWWGNEDYGDWKYYSVKFNYYPQTVDIESCVYDTYWPAYRDAKSYHDDHDSAVALFAAGALAILF